MPNGEEPMPSFMPDLNRKVQSHPSIIRHAKGKIVITLFPKGKGYDIDFNVTF